MDDLINNVREKAKNKRCSKNFKSASVTQKGVEMRMRFEMTKIVREKIRIQLSTSSSNLTIASILDFLSSKRKIQTWRSYHLTSKCKLTVWEKKSSPLQPVVASRRISSSDFSQKNLQFSVLSRSY